MEQKGRERIKRTQRDYSLAFKLQVIDEVEKGYLTYKEAQLKYRVQGRSTVLVWLRKHGRLDWSNSNPMGKGGKTPSQRIRELELALKRAKEDNQILQIAIDIADEELGTDIRKKYLPKQSEERKLRK
jgi:transposase-like protein